MARELEGKVAVVTGAASGIRLASTEAMLAAGSRVVMVDRDEAALQALCNKHGDAVIPPSGHRPARPEGLRYAAAESPGEGRPVDILHAMPVRTSVATWSIPTLGLSPDLLWSNTTLTNHLS